MTTVPTLAISTTVLPRMELPYIKDWIQYYRALGVDHILLYMDNTENVTDPIFDPEPHSSVGKHARAWSRKPGYDFRTGRSSQDIRDDFYDAIGEDVSCLSSSREECESHRPAQIRNLHDSIWRLREVDIDYMIHCDPDEFLLPRNPRILSNLPRFIGRLADEINDAGLGRHVSIPQVLMRARWTCDPAWPAPLGITSTKGLYRSPAGMGWKPVYHLPTFKDLKTESWQVDEVMHGRHPAIPVADPTDAVFFHYSGWEDHDWPSEEMLKAALGTFDTTEMQCYYRELAPWRGGPRV